MICISIMAKNTDRALKRMAKADTLADMIEIRLDVMEEFDLNEIIKSATKPILVTYRSKREGGRGSAGYGTRVRFLSDAVEAGADYVDVEFKIPLEHRQRIFQNRGSSEIVVSLHLRNSTPSKDKLEALLKNMAATGADIVKIVTQAKTPEDNLRVLGLISMAKKLGVKIIAFCMGPHGRISRVACTLMGGYLTFASLDTGQKSASGQIPAMEMRKILEALSL